MGLMDPAPISNGSDNTMSKLKGKYVRMDGTVDEEVDESMLVANKRKNGRSDSEKFVFACAFFASFNNVLLGYDVGVMSGVILFMKDDLKINEVQQEVLIGCLSIMSLIGSLIGGKTSDIIGRKWTIALAAVVFQTGAAIMTFAPNFLVIMIGRIFAGIGIGFGVMVAPVYIAEISPTIARGLFTSFPEIFINVGILLGYVSNYAFSGYSVHVSWRIMLGVGIIPSVFMAFALFKIPESPRWLVMKKRIDEARYVLIKISETEQEANARLLEIQEASNANSSNTNTVWQDIIRPTPSLRRMLITGLGIQSFQQITGIDATVYYSPTIFRDAGIESNSLNLAATIAVGVTKTAFILVATFLIDKLGRKPLLYVSTVGMTACLFGLSLTLFLLGQNVLVSGVAIPLVVLAVCGNVAFFSIGIGPVCWVITSEIFPLKVRAQASALGSVGNRLSSGLVAMSFLSLTKAISVAGTFLIFAVISAVSVVFVHFCVPETKGKSLEEIEVLFQREGDRERREVELEDVQHLVGKE